MWATCYPDNCFCEALGAGGVFQPVNTLSGLAFVVVAIVVLWQRRDLFSWVAALLSLLIGLGTAYYHARFTMAGQIADNLGMYALVLWFLWSRIRLRYAWYVLTLAASGAFLGAFPTLRRHLFALLTVVLLTVILRSWRSLRSAQRRSLGWAIGIFAVATVVWVLDITGLVCDPNSIIQLHALWHLLGAVVVWMLYRAFRP
jgi:hypothetical protein